MDLKVSTANPSFTAKQRFLTPQMHKDLKTVLTKMNSEAKLDSTEFTFTSKILTRLDVHDKANLCDGRMLLKKVAQEDQMEGLSSIYIGNKTKLIIDNKTGEIVNHNKPFYKTWSAVMKKLGESLTMFKEHYDDEKIVTKLRIGIKGFTEKGIERLHQCLNKK